MPTWCRRDGECTAQRDPLVSAGLEPPHIEDPLVEAWDALVAWATEEIPNRDAARTEQTKRAAEQDAALVAMLDELREAAGARSDASLSAMQQSAAAARDQREGGGEANRGRHEGGR